jgi:excisionase family DNA binding protein
LYAAIRRYRFDAHVCSEVVEQILERFVPLIRESQGLLAYYVIDTGDGEIATITICEDKEKVLQSSKVAAEWLKHHLASSIVSDPEVLSFSIEVEEPIQGDLYEDFREPAYKQALRLLSVNEVAEVLGMGRSWVYQQIRTGELPCVQLGGNVKVRQKDLEEYVEGHIR